MSRTKPKEEEMSKALYAENKYTVYEKEFSRRFQESIEDIYALNWNLDVCEMAVKAYWYTLLQFLRENRPVIIRKIGKLTPYVKTQGMRWVPQERVYRKFPNVLRVSFSLASSFQTESKKHPFPDDMLYFFKEKKHDKDDKDEYDEDTYNDEYEECDD